MIRFGGAGRGYVETVLASAGIKTEVLHTNRDALFGGGNPEPSEGHIDEMLAAVKKA